jgi:hypothetical protein
MIVTILLWIYFAFMTAVYGVGTVKLLRGLLRLQDDIILPFSVLVLLGLNTIAWMSSALSLFLKMSWGAHLFVFAGALGLAWFHRNEIKTSFHNEFRQKHQVYWMVALLGGITTLLYAVKVPSNSDTLLYHAQAIHWIEDFPVVPGLANLDPRLGLNSNWFVVNALFSLSFLKLQSFHLIPSFLFLTCLFYFLGGLQNILSGDLRLSQFFKTGFIPFGFYLLMEEISSPGTDLPVFLFYWVILCLWTESIERNEASRLLEIIVFFLSIFVITYKVSGGVTLLIGLWILARLAVQRNYRLLGICMGISVVILLPWLIRNFILSGYWLYPEPLMKTLSPNVDWQVPLERVVFLKGGIQAWGFSPGLRWANIASLSLQERLSIWFGRLTINQTSTFLVALFSPVLFGLFSLPARSMNKTGISRYWIVIFTGFLSLLFWLLSAPNFRFGYSFVIAMIVLGLAPLGKLLFEKLERYRQYLIIGLILILSLQQVHVMLGARRDGTQYLDYVVLPASYPHVSTDPCRMGDQTILCARNWRQCGYNAFPCVPQAPQNVEMRGDSLRAGFHSTRFK